MILEYTHIIKKKKKEATQIKEKKKGYMWSGLPSTQSPCLSLATSEGGSRLCTRAILQYDWSAQVNFGGKI